MSRSYKKNPYCTDNSSSKESKKFANKTVRHRKDIPSGGAYKKASESYNICDYKFYETWEDAKDYWEKNIDSSYYLQRHYPTLESYYKRWLRYYKNK